jgi:hypothetical protein
MMDVLVLDLERKALRIRLTDPGLLKANLTSTSFSTIIIPVRDLTFCAVSNDGLHASFRF